jgi:diaminopimelate decarboxylase
MSLNPSIHYINNQLYVDQVSILTLIAEVGTPIYVYSLKRALENLHSIQQAFTGINAHYHYSAKANGTLAILKTLIQAGAGVDAVSGGEIFRAIKAGANPQDIVFAGVGKTLQDIRYALEIGVGWFNIENIAEAEHINTLAQQLGKKNVRVAVRFNPDVTANTHPYIATGHGGAKFGLTEEAIRHLLSHQKDYPNLSFQGLHVHIGSNLQDTKGTVEAVERSLEMIAPYEHMKTINMGGGLPAKYHTDQTIPPFSDFADAVRPLLQGYEVILEPGRSIIADAGILVTNILYKKYQAGQRLIIIDASMTELIRPMLYQAKHQIVPIMQTHTDEQLTQVHGPVCETTDVMGRDVLLPELNEGDAVAVLTAGAYGTVMASNYNARPRPAEVIVHEDGQTWSIARQRETWDDLIKAELHSL